MGLKEIEKCACDINDNDGIILNDYKKYMVAIALERLVLTDNVPVWSIAAFAGKDADVVNIKYCPFCGRKLD